MAYENDIDIDLCTGDFNVNLVPVYNLLNIGRCLLNRFENTYNFLCEVGVISHSRLCPVCQRPLCMRLSLDKRPGSRTGTPLYWRSAYLRCKKLNTSVALRNGNMFEDTTLSIEQIVVIICLFVENVTTHQTVVERAQLTDVRLSQETVAEWLAYCREICIEVVARWTESTRQKIGGPGLTVEIDESRFTRKKCDSAVLVDGQWVVGGVCWETGEAFLAPCPGDVRGPLTLLDIIERHVHTQSTIIADCWKEYDQPDRDYWIHEITNYDYSFVDPEGGAQMIDSSWWQTKRRLPPTSDLYRGRFLSNFGEYLYRSMFRDEQHVFVTFMRHCAEIYPPRE